MKKKTIPVNIKSKVQNVLPVTTFVLNGVALIKEYVELLRGNQKATERAVLSKSSSHKMLVAEIR